MSRFHKNRFNHDISALTASNIVEEGRINALTEFFPKVPTILGRLMVLEGIKDSERLPSVSTNAKLQPKIGCGFTADGTTVWSDRKIEVKPVYTNEEYCNETFVGTYMESLLKLGLNGQNEDLVPEAVIVAMHSKNFIEKLANGVWNGDLLNTIGTTPAELQYFDGFKKIISAATGSINFASVTITNSNAHAVLENFAGAIPESALDEGVEYEIRVSRATARKVLLAIWRNKDYSGLVTGAKLTDPTIEFLLPISGFKVVSDKFLTNADVIAVPLNNAFFGTDAEKDLDFVDSKFDEFNEKLRVTVQARAGVQTNRPENWVMMTSTTSDKNTGGIDLEEDITCPCPEPTEAG